MNTNTGQSEDASTANQNPAAASVEESGATQIADGATSGGGQGHEGDDNSGQGNQQSKSQNSKARARRKLREAETRNAQLEEANRKLTERLSTLESKVDGVINPPAPRPDRINFETEEDYEDALIDWKLNKGTSSQQKPASEEPAQTQTQQPGAQQHQPQQQVSAEVQKVIDDWNDSCDDAAEKYEDFDEVAFGNNHPVTPIMRDALYECGNGGEAAYYLGKNPDEARRIAGLSLAGQVAAINEISEKFAPKTTNAPDPIDTLKPGDAGRNKSTHPLLEGATFE